MSTAHTPGPWQAVCPSPDDHRFPHVVIGKDLPYPDSSGFLHATITINQGASADAHVRGTGFGTTHETACANARLIATAPDLLAALQALVTDIEASGTRAFELDEARTAIAKAVQP